MKKKILPFILVILLAGCSSLPFQVPGLSVPTLASLATQIPAAVEIVATLTPVPSEGSSSVTSLPAEPTPAAIATPKVDSENTVTLFLEGRKTGVKFALISDLFSSTYAASIKDDTGLDMIFGQGTEITDFKVGAPTVSGDGLSSSLEATVYLPQPVNTRFGLIIENGEWKISDISVLSGISEYPTTPEGVVLAFLTAYQEAPDKMSNFLIPSRRAQQPPGGSTAMLQISGDLGGMVVQSAAVSPEPPTASILVTIRAGEKDYQRKFLLTKDTAGWGIDAIEILQ